MTADTCRVKLDFNDADSYRLFLRVKNLPRCRVVGRVAEFPAEYATALGLAAPRAADAEYAPWPGLFDYQAGIAALAVRKRKFALFVECGLGKTFIELEFARHCLNVLPADRRVLIVAPLMVVRQTLAEAARFYGAALPVEQVPAARLNEWLAGSWGACRLGLTNFEAVADGLSPGRLGSLIIDESSILKSAYGAWGRRLIELGRGLDWKLCATGTPAPNDRIEYASHAVFLDQEPTVNAFLARYFVNRGETQNRWELKPHALRPFYRALSHWCVFLSDPAVYGWKDNVGNIPPIRVHVHDVPMTAGQVVEAYRITGTLFARAGGIGSRTKLAQLAKGVAAGAAVATHKFNYVDSLLASWPGEQTVVWCLHNAEQDEFERRHPDAASVRGTTPYEDRVRLVDDFTAGRRRLLVSKPKVLGFGLNLQNATRHVFSGLQDSYESFWQAVKRSNRVGSTKPLDVHIPVTDLERPMIETVLAKAARVQRDTDEQQQIFKEASRVA